MAEERCETCPYHDIQVFKGLENEKDITNVNICMSALKKEAANCKIEQALMKQEIAMIRTEILNVKRPLWAIGSAMLLWVVQTLMKAIPALANLGGGQ